MTLGAQQVVSADAHDVGGGVSLTVQSISANQYSVQVEHIQQVPESGYLVELRVDLTLPRPDAGGVT